MLAGDVPSRLKRIVERDDPQLLPFPEIRKSDEHVAEDRRLFGEAVLKASIIAQTTGGFVVVRHRDDHGGDWSIPGGLVEAGESVEDAAVREMKEETGLDVALKRALAVIVSKIVAPHSGSLAYFRVVFLAGVAGGRLEAIDQTEIAEVKVANWHDVKKLIADGKFQRIPSQVEQMIEASLQGTP